MANIKKALKSKWGWTWGIVMAVGAFLGLLSFTFAVSFGPEAIRDIITLDIVTNIFPIALGAAIVNFFYGFVFGLGLERLYKG